MKPGKLPSLLPHEAFFGLYLVLTWLRLIWRQGLLGPEALVYAGLISVNLLFLLQSPTPANANGRWRLRLLFYPIAMNLVFFHMKEAIPKITSARWDTMLQRADHWLLGGNISLRLETLVHPFSTELFSLCYLLFFPYLLFSLTYYFVGPLPLLTRFTVGLFTVYGLGFLGYSLVPAAGPCFSMAEQFRVPLEGGCFTQWNAEVVARGSNGVDVFPSLHCAVSCFLLLFDRQHRRWRFWGYLLPCVGLWCSTLYLRYHYFVDVLCGFALAAVALWIADRYPIPADRIEPILTQPKLKAQIP